MGEGGDFQVADFADSSAKYLRDLITKFDKISPNECVVMDVSELGVHVMPGRTGRALWGRGKDDRAE